MESGSEKYSNQVGEAWGSNRLATTMLGQVLEVNDLPPGATQSIEMARWLGRKFMNNAQSRRRVCSQPCCGKADIFPSIQMRTVWLHDTCDRDRRIVDGRRTPPQRVPAELRKIRGLARYRTRNVKIEGQQVEA